MMLLVALPFVILMTLLAGCEKQPPAHAPVSFEISGLETMPEPSNTNAMKVTGTVRVHDNALKGKALLLRLGGNISFTRSGITEPLFPTRDEILITSGSGTMELWFYVLPEEKKAIEPELKTPTYSFHSDGYSELRPATLEVR